MYFCKECKGLFNKENIENKKNNTKYIREQYNWNIEAKKMREIYMQLLEV